MDNVSQTLFYPLFGRAQASDRWPELFPDPWAHKAMEIAAQEGTTAQPMDGFPELVYGLRHMILVQEARAYLETHPGAAVVNIGCGLDMRTGADSLIFFSFFLAFSSSAFLSASAAICCSMRAVVISIFSWSPASS